MLFNSLTFVVFFAIVLGVYHLLSGWSVRKGWLLAASYVFYGAWNPPFALLLAASTLVDWWAGLRLESAERTSSRRGWLLLSLLANFGVLGWFKYGHFLMENTLSLLAGMGVEAHLPKYDIILPVGISFYTFQTLSYTIDVYRRNLKAEPSLRDFAVYVSFFPQLVAGPIVRARDFLYQLASPPRPEPGRMGWGLFLMTLGLFQKMVLADTLLAPTRCWLRQSRRCLPMIFRSRPSMPGPGRWPSAFRFFSISPAIRPVPLARPCALGSACATIFATPMPPSVFQISGGAGTSRYRAGCEIISIFHWVGTVVE